MEVNINKIATHFYDLTYGDIFLYEQYYCMKIYNNETDSPMGLIVDKDSSQFMETVIIDYEELIYQIFPNSKLIIE